MNFILRYLSSMCALALFICLNCTSVEAIQPQIVNKAYNTFVLDVQGNLSGSGDNQYGQLGNGTTTSSATPLPVPGSWKSVGAGWQVTYGIKTDGTLWSWGATGNYVLGRTPTVQNPNKLPGQIGTDNDWVDVKGGYLAAIALKANGTIWAWGMNYWGQLGVGSQITYSAIPIQIGTDTDWRFISAGYMHVVAIKNNGTLYSWGYNLVGEVGDGTTSTVFQPVPIMPGYTWITATAGNYTTQAIRSDHSRWAWGANNANAYLGIGNTVDHVVTPIQADQYYDWIAVGYQFGLRGDGSIWSWGYYCGDGTLNFRLTPIPINTGITYAIIGSGANARMVGKSDGSIWVWGSHNQNGQYGNGTANSTKAKIPILSLFDVEAFVTLNVMANPYIHGGIIGPGIACGSQGNDCQEGYALNQQVTLTAIEEANYTLHYWFDGQNYTYFTTQLPVTMDASKTVTATFALLPGISVSISPAGGGSVVEVVTPPPPPDPTPLPRINCPAGGTEGCEEALDFNQQITLKAERKPGWQFDHWQIGETTVGTEATYTATITDVIHLTAVFIPHPYEATDFVFPVLKKGQTDPLLNKSDPCYSDTDPELDGGWHGPEVGEYSAEDGHLGQDYVMDTDNGDGDAGGEPVYAIAAGEVVEITNNPNSQYGWCDAADHGWGPVIVIRHERRAGFTVPQDAVVSPDTCSTDIHPKVVYSLYGHLRRSSIEGLQVGDWVAKGQPLGVLGTYSANPAESEQPWETNHLHGEIKDEAGFQEGAWYRSYAGVCPEAAEQACSVKGIGTAYSYSQGFAPHRYKPAKFISANMQ